MTDAEEKADSNEFEISGTRNNKSKISQLKTLIDIQSKAMINNLIIGGLNEAQDGMAEDVENTLKAFMFEDLKPHFDLYQSLNRLPI